MATDQRDRERADENCGYVFGETTCVLAPNHGDEFHVGAACPVCERPRACGCGPRNCCYRNAENCERFTLTPRERMFRDRWIASENAREEARREALEAADKACESAQEGRISIVAINAIGDVRKAIQALVRTK